MKRILLIAIIGLIPLFAASPALSDSHTWDTQNGSTGSWHDTSHWSVPDSYPNGPDDGAAIDSDPSVVSNVTYVNYSSGSSVNWISLAANTAIPIINPDGDPDRLNLTGFLKLVPSTTDESPQLSNNGLFYLNGSLSFQEEIFEEDYGKILGSGVLRLGPDGWLSGTFSNGPGHVIEGRGGIGFSGAGPEILNRGVIRPNQGTLRVSGTIVNTPGFGGPAVLRGDAELDSLLYFDGATIEGGSIEAAAGPVTMIGTTISNLMIANGTLRVIGTGSISKMGRGVTIAAGAELRLQGDPGYGTPKLWVRDEQFADPITIQNNGTISLDGLYTNGLAEMKVYVPDGQSPNYLTLAGPGTLLLGLTECSGDCYGNNNLSAGFSEGGIQAGYIQLDSHSIRGYGRISAPLLNQGRVTAANGGTLTLQEDVTNANLTDPDWENGPLGTLAATPGARLFITGGAIIQLGQLEPDGGTIAFHNALLGQTSWGPGDYEIVSNGVLQLMGVNTLDAAAVMKVTAGSGGSSKLEIYGGDEPELVKLVNNGEIAMDNATQLRQLGNYPAILSGSGTIKLGVAGFGSTSVIGDATANMGFINGPDHTIRGAGTVSTTLVNNGELIAENGYLTFSNPFELSGTGNVRVNDGGWLNWSANLGTHNLTLEATAGLIPYVSTSTFVLSGNFSFFQTDESLWVGGNGSYSNPSLTMASRDGTPQTLEVGSRDFGAVYTGFNGHGAPNFDLKTFTVSGTSTRVMLVDDIDNGNRTSPEALYVQTLSVLPGATLDLNGLALYTLQNGPVQIMEGDGADFGGGTIIDSGSMVDTDFDGMPDSWEQQIADADENDGIEFIEDVDPLDDFDSDGFSNLRELLSKTNPMDLNDIPTLLADFDDDGDVDGSDLNILAAGFGSTNCPCIYDLNNDEDVDEIDVFLFSEDFGALE